MDDDASAQLDDPQEEHEAALIMFVPEAIGIGCAPPPSIRQSPACDLLSWRFVIERDETKSEADHDGVQQRGERILRLDKSLSILWKQCR